MPSTPNISGLRDNHTRGSVADFLNTKIQTGSALSVVSAYFTIYAYDALKVALDRIDHLDFLFGELRRRTRDVSLRNDLPRMVQRSTSPRRVSFLSGLKWIARKVRKEVIYMKTIR